MMGHKTEYTCTKCGTVCEVEYGVDGTPWHACSWCYECNDYPGGWVERGAMDAETDWIAGAADAARVKTKEAPNE